MSECLVLGGEEESKVTGRFNAHLRAPMGELALLCSMQACQVLHGTRKARKISKGPPAESQRPFVRETLPHFWLEPQVSGSVTEMTRIK